MVVMKVAMGWFLYLGDHGKGVHSTGRSGFSIESFNRDGPVAVARRQQARKDPLFATDSTGPARFCPRPMRPITFICEETLSIAPGQIAAPILDPANWPKFVGYGPIPAVRLAEFEIRTPRVVGSRVRVASRDGSTHVEEIAEWQPERRLRLRFKEFSPPFSRLATEFEER
jgi:hypothetical protein